MKRSDHGDVHGRSIAEGGLVRQQTQTDPACSPVSGIVSRVTGLVSLSSVDSVSDTASNSDILRPWPRPRLTPWRANLARSNSSPISVKLSVDSGELMLLDWKSDGIQLQLDDISMTGICSWSNRSTAISKRLLENRPRGYGVK